MKTTKAERILDNVTGDIDQDKLSDALTNKGTNESDRMLVETIKNRYEAMKSHRDNSCPSFLKGNDSQRGLVGVSDNEVLEHLSSSTSPSSWSDHWQRCYDSYSMESSANIIDEDLNQITSPIIFSNIQAVLAQFQDANTTGSYTSQAGVSETYARIAEFWQKNWEDKVNAMDTLKIPTFRESIVTGTCISHNSHIRKVRNVSKMLTAKEVIIEFIKASMDEAEYNANEADINENPDNFIDQQSLEVIKQEIAKDPSKYLTKDEVVIDFDDFYSEPVPVEEFFVDPDALNLNDVTRDARDCIWTYSVPYQSLIYSFKNSEDPFVVKSNLSVDLLSKTSAGNKLARSINDELKNNNNHEVVIIKYYNKYTDQYIILANDVIIRKGPLPYNHKLLPFSVGKCIPLKNSFYGVGIAALLDNIQSRDQLYNAIQDHTTLHNANLPGVYMDKSGTLTTTLNELSESRKAIKSGQFIKLGEGDTFDRMLPLIDNGDIAKRRDELDITSTKISMVSPLMVGQMARNSLVRNNQMIQENSMLGIRMYINQWAKMYEDLLFQGIHILKQVNIGSYEESVEAVKSYQGANPNTLKKYRNIKIEGYEVTGYGDDLKIKPTDESSEFELTEDVLDSFDKIKVSIKIETSALASKTMQAQELQDTMGLVMNIMSNPVLKENRLVLEMLKQYLSKKNMDPKIMSLLSDDDSEESKILGLYQNENMKQGMDEPPIPGMSNEHLMIHSQLLMEVIMERESLLRELTANAQMSAQQGFPPDEGMQAQFDQLTEMIDSIQKHLAGDRMIQSEGDSAALTMAQGAMQQNGQPPEQPPEQLQPTNRGGRPKKQQEPQEEDNTLDELAPISDAGGM